MKKNLWEKDYQAYKNTIFQWRSLPQQDRMKKTQPTLPDPRLKIYTGYSVTAVNKLDNQSELFLTCETDHWRKQSDYNMLTIKTNCIITANGVQKENPIIKGISNEETGFYTIGKNDQGLYGLTFGIKKIKKIQQSIFKLFSKVSLSLIISSTFFSCALFLGDLKQKKIDQSFISSGFVQYFLPGFPDWLNRSEIGQCFRSNVNRYLKMPLLMKSLKLNYLQARQLQLSFNYKLVENSSKKTFPEEEKVFLNSVNNVKLNINTFSAPTFNRIHIIWVDPLLPDQHDALRKLMSTPIMDQGYPILISLCLSQRELKAFGKKAMPNHGNSIKYLSNELFSPYSKETKLIPYNQLYLNAFSNRIKKYLSFYQKK